MLLYPKANTSFIAKTYKTVQKTICSVYWQMKGNRFENTLCFVTDSKSNHFFTDEKKKRGEIMKSALGY